MNSPLSGESTIILATHARGVRFVASSAFLHGAAALTVLSTMAAAVFGPPLAFPAVIGFTGVVSGITARKMCIFEICFLPHASRLTATTFATEQGGNKYSFSCSASDLRNFFIINVSHNVFIPLPNHHFRLTSEGKRLVLAATPHGTPTKF